MGLFLTHLIQQYFWGISTGIFQKNGLRISPSFLSIMLVVLEDLVHGRPEETTDQSVCSERCLLHVHADDSNPLSTVSQKLKRIGDTD